MTYEDVLIKHINFDLAISFDILFSGLKSSLMPTKLLSKRGCELMAAEVGTRALYLPTNAPFENTSPQKGRETPPPSVATGTLRQLASCPLPPTQIMLTVGVMAAQRVIPAPASIPEITGCGRGCPSLSQRLPPISPSGTSINHPGAAQNSFPRFPRKNHC